MPQKLLPVGRRHVRVAASVALLAIVCAVSACIAPKRVGQPGARPLGPAPMARPGGPVLVRIGMAEELESVKIGATGPWQLSERAFDGTASALSEGLDVTLTLAGGEVVARIGDLRRSARWFTLAPVDPASPMVWDGRRWRGELHVIPTPGGSGLTVINVLELESYLAGVVPREIGPGRKARDLAAVAAQAIAARTYTISKLDRQRARGFDLYADVRDQAYGGVDWEDSLASAAITRTAGLVLRHGERLVPTYYHSTCGGHTASIDEVWPYDADPVLEARPDHRPDGEPWCAASKFTTWQQRWSWSELNETLQETLPAYLDYVGEGGRRRWERDLFTPAGPEAIGRRPGALRDMEVLSRTSSGRVDELAIATEAGTYVVRGDRIRWVLRPPTGGPSILRSSWIELTVERDRAVIARGRGWGHGLGLCQMGAIGRSRAGQDAVAILEHYYPGARVVPLSGGALP